MIVLDASAWVDVLAGQGDDALLRHDELVVPPHFDVEVLASVRSLAQRRVISDGAADRAKDRHLRAPFTRTFDPADAIAAWELREAMSFRDAWYAALARRLQVPWITADGKAAGVAERLGVQVRLI